MTKYVQLSGTHQVNIEGTVKKGGLMFAVECWMKMLVQMFASARVPSPVSGDITKHNLMKWQTSKLIYRITKKCRGPQKILQSGHMFEHRRFTQIIDLWLAKQHERKHRKLSCELWTIGDGRFGLICSRETWSSFDIAQVEASLPEAWQWKKIAWLESKKHRHAYPCTENCLPRCPALGKST
jgi:hypothetical protein